MELQPKANGEQMSQDPLSEIRTFINESKEISDLALILTWVGKQLGQLSTELKLTEITPIQKQVEEVAFYLDKIREAGYPKPSSGE